MKTEINLDTAVRSISTLPELLIPKDIFFESPSEKQIIIQCKYFYRGLEEWLKHLVLKQSLCSEALFTDWQHFQGHAVLESSSLNLITGLYPRVPLLQEACSGENAPVEIWFMRMFINCKIALMDCGILGKSSLTGKVDFQKNNFELLDRYNEHTIRVLSPEENADTPFIDELDFFESPDTVIIALASELASQDEDFDKDYWQPYYKTEKRWIRKIRENKHLQSGCLLPSGELMLTGVKKKIPPSVRSSVSKGFGNKP
jgi:hypothetical protein